MSELVYHGVVHDRLVVLPPDVQLPEGMQVEVRAMNPESAATGDQSPEEEFKQRLLELGIISEIKRPPSSLEEDDPIPIQVAGTPLSEMIIVERR